MATVDPFIVTTTLAGIKPDASSRRFIRSHVMRGKNRRSDNRRSPPAALGSWINGDQSPDYQTPEPAYSSQSLVQIHSPAPLRIYPQVTAIDMSSLPFAADMEPYMVELLVNCEPPLTSLAVLVP